MGRPKKVAVETVKEETKEVKPSTQEFIYETNGIRYKKVIVDGIIVSRERI